VGLSFGCDPFASPFLRPSWLRAFGLQSVKADGAETSPTSSDAPANAAPRLTLVKSAEVELEAAAISRDESSR
jgi:hypothetical protein